MDMMKTLSNPWVLGGGLVLGVIVLVMNNGGGASSASASTVGANLSYNEAALSATTQQAQISANLGVAQFSADVASQDNNSSQIQQTLINANAGITNSQIQSNAAMVIDQSNNNTRLGLGYQQEVTSITQSNNSVSIANAQAKAQEAASNNSLFTSIAGDATKLLMSPL
jgi:hypothetical protein